MLEQVTDLFADQPDLLKEFTYFLPDGVQAQAKERLDRAAEEAEIRLGLRGGNVSSQNGQRSSSHLVQSGFQPSQGRSRQASMNMPRGMPSRGRRVLQKEQDWHDPRLHRLSREGSMHRGYHPGLSPHAQYPNGMGGDPGRSSTRHHYPGSNDGGHGWVDGFRGGRRNDRAEHRWRSQEVEDNEFGTDAQSSGGRKRGRVVDYPGGRGSGAFRTSPEHHLFDQTRHVLSSGGDTNDWNEFLKCLDLFSNQVFGREEMLSMVQELFDNHNEVDLMEDFRLLVERRGSLEPPPRDSWPTMGLSEINFQSANKCTPSYRELPTDYQLADCSGRSAAEERVLNDRWASVPVGSEDSNNFKHMRRNPHEDVLFKMEDERFELDMLIDGVSTAIARLEPVEEEIEALRATAESAVGLASGESDEARSVDTATPVGTAGGNVGASRRFQYRLDRRTLGALHLSTVSRLYGEHGAEVLDLVRRNPAVAIPVVLKRLREKEKEWRSAREKAKSGWKELAQKNFHRSLDHRSHHFRREDKRNTSNRVLLQEIKDKKVEEDPQKAAFVKAAREHVQDTQDDAVLLLGRISPTSTAADVESLSAGQGSTGEPDLVMDSARSDGGARDTPEIMVINGGNPTVSGGRPRSKEGIRLLRQQAEENPPWYMFAHLTLLYPTEDTACIHEDIMELISHTLARRPPSEEDVRQASAVVADLLPTFFGTKNPRYVVNGGDSSVASREGEVDSRGHADLPEARTLHCIYCFGGKTKTTADNYLAMPRVAVQCIACNLSCVALPTFRVN